MPLLRATKLDLDNFQPFMSAVLLEGLSTKSDRALAASFRDKRPQVARTVFRGTRAALIASDNCMRATIGQLLRTQSPIQAMS